MTAMAGMITVMGKTNETVSKMHSCEITSPIIKATFSHQGYFRTEAMQHIGTAISFYSHDENEKMYYARALNIPCISKIQKWMEECSNPKTMPFSERLFATILADTVLMSVSCMIVRFCEYNQSKDATFFRSLVCAIFLIMSVYNNPFRSLRISHELFSSQKLEEWILDRSSVPLSFTRLKVSQFFFVTMRCEILNDLKGVL